MRGKECLLGSAPNPFGITPAYAGKSWFPSRGLLADQDHPRVCGEKYPVMDDAFIDMGSPPRVRGKARDRADTTRRTGITPAYAGKSYTQNWLAEIV